MPIPPAPNPIGNPIRQLLVLQSVPHRWPFALRAALCVAVPVLVGWAVGDVAAGLLATIGGFTALYGSGRPYLNRAVHLAVIAVCLGLSVALGNWAAEVPWAGVLTVSAIAVAAVLLCNALLVGPPGAYMFVLACAAGIGAAHEHVAPWRIGLLVLAGGAFAWLVHMSGALIRFRGPEKSAVVSAAESVAGFIEAVGSSAEVSARHRAAVALHQSWSVLINFQPLIPAPSSTLRQLRAANHRLHVVFAEAMTAAEDNRPLPAGQAQRARGLGTLAGCTVSVDGDRAGDDMPLGRPGPLQLLREAIRPGSTTLPVVARVGIAVPVAGFIASALGVDHAYWAMSAAVLILHQGLDWLRTLQRGIQRLLGTWAGLVLAAVILGLHPQGLWLVLTVAVLQFTIEMFVVRNYALAVVFITPAALTIASGGLVVGDVGDLLLARGLDTLIGFVVAVAVYLPTARRGNPARLAEAIARTLDAVAATSRHLALGEVTTVGARAARRDLQVRALAMRSTYEAAVAGAARGRRSAECKWPAVAATEELAYRTLAGCWVVQRATGADTARGVGLSWFGPGGVDRFTAALGRLAAAARTGSAPTNLEELPDFGAAELVTLRESLVPDAQ